MAAMSKYSQKIAPIAVMSFAPSGIQKCTARTPPIVAQSCTQSKGTPYMQGIALSLIKLSAQLKTERCTSEHRPTAEARVQEAIEKGEL